MRFYVYALYSSERPTIPFYIGKGSGDRLLSHIKRYRRRKDAKGGYIRNILGRGGNIEAQKLFDKLSEEDAFRIERETILFYGRKPNGPLFNFTDGGEGTSGRTVSQETRSKIRAALTGVKSSPELRAKLSAIKKVAMNRPEVKARISAALTGRKATPEHCEAISKGLTGKPRDPTMAAKLGVFCRELARRPDVLERNRQAHIGKKASDETRLKMSLAKRGKPKSEEHRRKISESNKRTKQPRNYSREPLYDRPYLRLWE